MGQSGPVGGEKHVLGTPSERLLRPDGRSWKV